MVQVEEPAARLLLRCPGGLRSEEGMGRLGLGQEQGAGRTQAVNSSILSC